MKKNFIASQKYKNSKISFGFFTRLGGISQKKFSSLNCSFNSNDQISNVKKNILKAQKELKLDNKKIKFVNQIHSNKIVLINKNNYSNKFDADAMITQDKDISLAILTADCCPIFLFDDDNSFISCLHVGWKGAYSNIISNALNNINKIQPKIDNINAVIGPCLNKDNFEVNEFFKKSFIKANSNYKEFFSKNTHNSKSLFDMQNLIKSQLMSKKITNIDNLNIDTYSNKNLFFSHRRSTHLKEIPTGRMINIIGFK